MFKDLGGAAKAEKRLSKLSMGDDGLPIGHADSAFAQDVGPLEASWLHLLLMQCQLTQLPTEPTCAVYRCLQQGLCFSPVCSSPSGHHSPLLNSLSSSGARSVRWSSSPGISLNFAVSPAKRCAGRYLEPLTDS